ncbi:flavin reductase family protein [Pseudonocardia spinosispora]|uniref:flavin reductase family protein n=1 Tax=Pseudonocardia spinosispora TaxID=103441 RepID=UPI0005693C0E|nr:flavin reductase family protein [Pseudonocardia spinosispora]
MSEQALAPAELRSVLGHFASGVSVVTASTGAGPVGMTLQSFCSLSLDPPMVLICPGQSSTSWPGIEGVGRLCVNVLAEGQGEVARQFARSGIDRYAGISWTPAPSTGSPVLTGALAWIDCEIDSVWPGGDHLLVCCRVLSLAADPDLSPLVFFRSDFVRTGGSRFGG